MIITITLNAALDRTLRIEQPLVVGNSTGRCQLSGTGRQGYQCFAPSKRWAGTAWRWVSLRVQTAV